MNVIKTAKFQKQFGSLPASARRLFSKLEIIFEKNWLDPRLHIKKLKELAGTYSFRITRQYRALFYFNGERVIFFSIGHRKDIYQ